MSEATIERPRTCPTSGRPTTTLKVHIEPYIGYDALWWRCQACGGWHCDKIIRREDKHERV